MKNPNGKRIFMKKHLLTRALINLFLRVCIKTGELIRDFFYRQPWTWCAKEKCCAYRHCYLHKYGMHSTRSLTRMCAGVRLHRQHLSPASSLSVLCEPCIYTFSSMFFQKNETNPLKALAAILILNLFCMPSVMITHLLSTHAFWFSWSLHSARFEFDLILILILCHSRLDNECAVVQQKTHLTTECSVTEVNICTKLICKSIC